MDGQAPSGKLTQWVRCISAPHTSDPHIIAASAEHTTAPFFIITKVLSLFFTLALRAHSYTSLVVVEG